MKLPAYQRLSKEQDRINGLPLDGNWLVTGPPGTGKTVIGLYRASMLQKQGRPVNVLVWSRVLRMYVEKAVKELGIDDAVVATFDRWIHQVYERRPERKPPKITGAGDYDYDWDRIHSDAESFPRLSDLLVDEGQDLPKEFYFFARLVSGHMTVFADENQTITERRSSIADIRRYAGIREHYELRRNYRNTRKIALVARSFYRGLPTGVPDLPDEEPGRRESAPILRSFADITGSAGRIARWAKSRPGQEIGVFVPSLDVLWRLKAALLAAGLEESRLQVYHRPRRGRPPKIDFDVPGVLLAHHTNAKGLEFDTVFLPELNAIQGSADDPQTSMLFYVLCSRARSHLEFHYSGPGRPPVVRLLPDVVLSEDEGAT